jgi:hypothetical protein
MIPNNQKTSLLVPFQLPGFIRDNPDYSNFITFLQAYYEWMEQSGNAIDGAKNLLDYHDIDSTTDQFMQYFVNDFLPNFPAESLISQDKAIKVARQLYQTKGTPASYQFLFQVLYGSDFDYFFTEDAVFKPSSGTWYVPKSLSLASDDPNFLTLVNASQGSYRVFGETTKSIATIENVVQEGVKTEVFISNIERLFQSGEFAHIVDSNNQPVYFNGNLLRAKIVGQISSISINPNNRGLFYQPGNPVVVYGGLNSPTGHGATATVGTVTSGSIQRINLVSGGYGYQVYPNTNINIVNGGGAIAQIGGLNTAPSVVANVSLIPVDSITLKQFITIGNTQYNFSNNLHANANTSLANAFNFINLSTYPISSVLVENGGGGITQQPTITANSVYATDVGQEADLGALGILAPIQIVNGGVGYTNNDIVVINGGSGYGAYANVTVSNTTNATGVITTVTYVYPGNQSVPHFPLGGLGYQLNNLPTVSIVSANTYAANASLVVPGILGQGAAFNLSVDRVGSITTINISDYGEDYIAAPNVSLKIQDIVVSNVSLLNTPQEGDVVYQGSSLNTSTYLATVASTTGLIPYADPTQSLYTLRVFNYNSVPNFSQPLNIYQKNIHMNITNSYSPNLVSYGDGTALATSAFLNGLTIGQGQYLDTSGQPSSFDVLQSTKYNAYTYEITVEKEIAKYKTTLLNLLHPAGMQLIGRFSMRSANTSNSSMIDVLNAGSTLEYYTGAAASMATLQGTVSNNMVTFTNLSGANLQQIIVPGDLFQMTTANGDIISSTVITVNDNNADNIILRDNVWTEFANVATITGQSGNSQINITSLTGSYNLVNGGVYSNTQYNLMDIVRAGDTVTVANNTSRTVTGVDYIHNIVYLNSNLSANANSYLSVNRTYTASAAYVQIFGSVGVQYFPEITTESGNQITTENGYLILLG